MEDRPRMVLLVGLPASGKSTWARQQGSAVISTDDIRFLLSDDASNQAIHRPVFATLRYLVRRRLELQRPVTYVDATNLTVWERRGYIKLGQLFGARMEAIFFDTPIEVCKQRNRQRERVVPDSALDSLAARLVVPTTDEGLEAVTIYKATAAAS